MNSSLRTGLATLGLVTGLSAVAFAVGMARATPGPMVKSNVLFLLGCAGIWGLVATPIVLAFAPPSAACYRLTWIVSSSLLCAVAGGFAFGLMMRIS